MLILQNMKNANQKIRASISWVIYFLINGIYLIVIPSIKKRFLKPSWNELYNDFNRFGRLGLKSFGIKSQLVNPHNIDLSKQHIIAANHRSWFDQIAIMGLYPKNVHFLAKSDYFKVPFFKYCLNNYEVIPVEKKKLTQNTNQTLHSYIDRGDDVVFFVEGTRGSGRNLLTFKKGAFKQAARTGLPLLPMYILGSEQCLCKKNTLLSVNKGNIVVILGSPVYFTNENLDEQIEEFEVHYRQTHDHLYMDYDKFQAQKGISTLRPILGFGNV